MDSYTIFVSLRDTLADLYSNPTDALVIVADAEFAVSSVAFRGSAQTNWHYILVNAIRNHRLDALLNIALTAYSENQTLQASYNLYHHFIDQGGTLELSASLPTEGSIVQSITTEGGIGIAGAVTTEGGNFIGRDQNISGDVIYGDKLTVIREQASPRIPLERPPRAQHFVGREAELNKLLADMQLGQVVTLCGLGGVGKTALAAEAIWRLTIDPAKPPQRFPDGVIFHNFYTQPQAALALEHIVCSFGEEPRPTLALAAQRVLAGKRVLVFLDSIEEADDLKAVLEVCDICCVLMTSRRHSDALTTRQDVAPLPVGEAVTLLQAWSGATVDDRVARQICVLVGELPTAVRLAGRYLLATESDATEYLAWLQAEPLAALDQGQRREESVPLLLESSLARVTAGARQVLALISVLALAPFSREIVAAALELDTQILRKNWGIPKASLAL